MKATPVARIKYLVFATLLIVFLCVNEAYFRSPLYDFSVDFIQNVQEKIPTDIFRYIFQIISGLANPIFIIVIFAIMFILPADKILLVKLAMYVISIGYVLSIIKTLFANPRPYWISPDDPSLPNYVAPGITPLESYAEFGNPSGHLFFTMGFYGYLYYLYIKANPERTSFNENLLRHAQSQADQANISWEEDPQFDMRLSAVYRLSMVPSKKKSISHTKLNIICVCFIIVLAFARLYLGMHTINQVILGFAIGCYYLFLMITYIDPAVEEPLNKLFSNEFENKPFFRWKLTICYLVLTMIPVIIYIIQNAMNPVASSQVWTQWWPVVSAEISNNPAKFGYIRCFLDASVLGALFGLVFSMLGFETPYSHPTVKLFQISLKRFILRTLIMVIMVGVPAVAIYFIPFGTGSFILQYFINHNFAFFIATYIMVKYVPIVYTRYGLEMPGDFVIPIKTKPNGSMAETVVSEQPV